MCAFTLGVYHTWLFQECFTWVEVGKKPRLVQHICGFSYFPAKKIWHPWFLYCLELYGLWEMGKLSSLTSFEFWHISNSIELTLQLHIYLHKSNWEYWTFIFFFTDFEKIIMPGFLIEIFLWFPPDSRYLESQRYVIILQILGGSSWCKYQWTVNFCNKAQTSLDFMELTLYTRY